MEMQITCTITEAQKASYLLSMAGFVIFLLLSSIEAVLAQQNRSIISVGSSLTPTSNSSWLSPSGLYAFGFFPEKDSYAVGIFIVGISAKTVVWTANTDDPTVEENASLLITETGRLIVQQTGRPDIQIADPPPSAIVSASMLDSGNFVLYGDNSTVVWQSFDHPTDTLLGGQHLSTDNALVSSASDNEHGRGLFTLVMQSDGNLVQYPVNSPKQPRDAYYASNTDMTGNNVSLNLDNNGCLYLLNGTALLKNITTGYSLPKSIYLLSIDADGIFRLYSHPASWEGNWTMRWQSAENKCQPKGICGFNSFCVLMDQVRSCKCLPGFDSVQTRNDTAGCTKASAEGICDNNNSSANYEIKQERNTWWQESVYEELLTSTVENCESACLGDCNCEAAIFSSGKCRKQRLPMSYGKQHKDNSDIALVKLSTTPPSPDQGRVVLGNPEKVKKKDLRWDILGIGIALIAVGVLFMVISVIYAHRKHMVYTRITKHGQGSQVDDVSLRAFTYTNLDEATDGFKQEIGKGASGTVFKGFLRSSQKLVAVKRLEKECTGEKEFQTEIKTIGKTYHRNLVQLLGYCLDGPNRLLVFEYMSNGSLADILFKADEKPCWEDRIKMARDIARGILYLHEECETQIIHCDIKPQNILLDQHLSAKISDFGVAKLLKQDQSNTYTGIRGTKGYVAPEWHRNEPITVKADVYSFGIVLLEIICCRRCIDWSLSEDEAILEDWVNNCYASGHVQIITGEMGVHMKKLERVVKIGLWCVQYDPSLRPSMKKVLLMLEGTVDIPVPPSPTSFFSCT